MPTNFSIVTCSACRAYGVPLIDNLCPACYDLQEKPKRFRPVLLPIFLIDQEGRNRLDARRTRKPRIEY